MVKWSFPGSLYFENTRKNFKSNLELVVVLVLEPKGQFALSLGKERSYILSKFKPLITDTSLIRPMFIINGF